MNEGKIKAMILGALIAHEIIPLDGALIERAAEALNKPIRLILADEVTAGPQKVNVRTAESAASVLPSRHPINRAAPPKTPARAQDTIDTNNNPNNAG